jgi:permuted papain-like amidase YaeF/Yiix C92 family enzyme
MEGCNVRQWRPPAAIVVAALLAACAAAPFDVARPAPEARHDAATLSEVRALGRGGDWLVIRGYHLSDNLVASLTNKPFSHAAVLDRENDSVIEAEAQGVHVTALPDFVAKSHRLLLIRPIWSTAASGEAAVRKARAVVGRPYDFLGLIGLDIPERFYCSGLTVEVYRPFIHDADLVPRPVEPGQLHYWGRILYDSGAIQRAADNDRTEGHRAPR